MRVVASVWVRMQTGTFQDEKLLRLLQRRQWRPVVAFIASILWCGQQENDGLIRPDMLRAVWATSQTAAQLVEAGLWRVVDEGWQVAAWAKYQPSRTIQEAAEASFRDAAAAEVAASVPLSEDGPDGSLTGVAELSAKRRQAARARWNRGGPL